MNPQEYKIWQAGKAQGKDDAFIKNAILAYRSANPPAAPAATTAPAAPTSLSGMLFSGLTQNRPATPPATSPIASANKSAFDVVKGFGKSVVSDLQGLGNVIAKPVAGLIDKLTLKPGQTAQPVGIDAAALAPTNADQSAGKALAQTAEFALPAAKGLQLPGFANVASQFLLNAGIRYGQTDGNLNDSLVSGGLGALFAAPKPLIEAAKPTLIKVLGFFSGFNDNILSTALERTPGAVATTKAGEPALTDIVKKTAAGLNDYANNLLNESKATVGTLTKESIGGAGRAGTRQYALSEGRQFIANITDSLRSDFNIGVQGNGELLMNRGTFPSNIVSRSDQSAIQDAFTLVKGIQKDTSIGNINAVLERMLTLKSKTPVGSPTGAETQKVIGQMMSEVVKFTRSLSDVAPAYGDYAAFLEQNLPNRVFINDARELFGASKNLSPKETSQITKRLLQLFNSGNSEIKTFAETVGAKTGQDLTGGAAGALINTGDQVSMRAANLSRRGVVEKIVETIPRALLRSYIKNGELVSQPVVKKLAELTRQSAAVIAQEVAAAIEGN